MNEAHLVKWSRYLLLLILFIYRVFLRRLLKVPKGRALKIKVILVYKLAYRER